MTRSALALVEPAAIGAEDLPPVDETKKEKLGVADVLRKHGLTEELIEFVLKDLTAARRSTVTKRFAPVPTTLGFKPKTPLQMRLAVRALRKIAEPATIDEWGRELARQEDFSSVQPPEKVIGFYVKRMIEEGFVEKA